MQADWIFRLRPQSIAELALYPQLRKHLEYYEDTGDFSHLILHGDTGTGKTTAARILGSVHNYDITEVDCARDSSKTAMLKLMNTTISRTLFGTRRIILMDEFHDVAPDTQKIFNKQMEDRVDTNIFIFCVNDIDAVAPPIVSRCVHLRFDVCTLNPKTHKSMMLEHTGMTKYAWKDELKRTARAIAKKDNKTLSNKQLEECLSNEFYHTDVRKFLMSVEKQIKMDEWNKTR